MGQLRIFDVARLTGVSGKTLRYWESLGLLPRPMRSRSGYRYFGLESVQRVEFIRKAKSIGLTLGEIARVLKLAERGGDPCPEVVRWAEEKMVAVEQQIKFLSDLRCRLERFRRETAGRLPCPPTSPSEICCLIERLPSPKAELWKGGRGHAKTLVAVPGRARGVGR